MYSSSPLITKARKCRNKSDEHNAWIVHRKVAHLDFFEAHDPNFEWLILYCLSSIGQAASHVY